MNDTLKTTLEELEALSFSFSSQLENTLEEASYIWRKLRSEYEAPACDELEESYIPLMQALDDLSNNLKLNNAKIAEAMADAEGGIL